MSIEAELDALKDHITQATAGITRPATVLDDEVSGFYSGTFPLVEIVPLERNVTAETNNPRGVGSTGAAMAQSFAAPNRYGLRIRSQTDAGLLFAVKDAQRETWRVSEAIEVWFSVVAHRTLPDGSGNARVRYAGPPFRWRGNPAGPYEVADATLGVIWAGSITVLGLARRVT